MKKILVYYDSMHSKGGIERVIANLFNVLSKYYCVTILTTDDTSSIYELSNRIKMISMHNKRKLNMNRSKIHRVKTILLSLSFNINFLKKVVNNYDYIYVATPLNTLEVFLSDKAVRKKIVVSEHASYYAGNILFKFVRKFIYPKLSIISVPTTKDTHIYKNMNCNSIYIPHLCTFRSQNANFNNKIALNVGRLTADKQQILLLKMWKELQYRNLLNGWILRIVGDGELKNELQNYINDNNLSSCVELLGSTNYIEQEYEKASIFLFTSKAEGFGMVLLEAMAYGLPCIAFDCPSGPRDIVKNNVNGFLIDCFDLKIYEEKICLLLSDDELLRKLSYGALQTVKNWDNEKIIDIWKEKVFI